MWNDLSAIVMCIHQHVDDSVVIMIYCVTFELTVINVASETYTLFPRYFTFSIRVHASYDTYTLIAKLEKPNRPKQWRQCL